jgi:hypothetical protein
VTATADAASTGVRTMCAAVANPVTEDYESQE